MNLPGIYDANGKHNDHKEAKHCAKSPHLRTLVTLRYSFGDIVPVNRLDMHLALNTTLQKPKALVLIEVAHL